MLGHADLGTTELYTHVSDRAAHVYYRTPTHSSADALRGSTRLACVHAGLLLEQRIRRANVPMGGPSMRGAARNFARPQV